MNTMWVVIGAGVLLLVVVVGVLAALRLFADQHPRRRVPPFRSDDHGRD